MSTFNKIICHKITYCLLLPLLIMFSIFYFGNLLNPSFLSAQEGQDAQSAQDQDLQEISQGNSQEDNPDFTNDTKNDYIDPLREIIAIGVRLGRQLNEGQTGNYNEKYFVEYVASDATDKLGSDIFTLSERAGVNHIRNLRHIISGYLQSRYDYNQEDAAIISTSVTNYNALYRQNMSYMEQKYAPAVFQKLDSERLGLSLNHADWPGQTQMLIPLKASSLGGSPEIDLEELKRNEIEEFSEIVPIVEAEAEVEAAPVVEPEPAPVKEVPPPKSHSGIIILIILIILLILLLLFWLKKRKKEPSPVVAPPKPVEPIITGPILSRYFPLITADREEFKLKTINQRIEVPYDQYQDWVTHITEQIHQGKISTQNLKAFQDSKDAEKAAASILSRGNLTYLQAKNISKSGRIEALRFDAQTGIVHTDSTFGIGCVGQFAIARWNGIPEEDALRITVLQELISGNISLNSLRKQMPQDISDQDLIQSFELISWLLVDKLYKVAEFGKDAVCNAAGVLLDKDIRGGAAKSYLAKVLRSNSTDNLVKMPIRILPDFAAQKFVEGESELEASHSAVALFVLRFAQQLDKDHLHNQVCRSVEKAIRSLRENYAVTPAQYYKELEPTLLAKFSEASSDAWIEKLYAQDDSARQDFVYRDFETYFAEALSQKEPIHLRDEQIQTEINSLEQQILQALK